MSPSQVSEAHSFTMRALTLTYHSCLKTLIFFGSFHLAFCYCYIYVLGLVVIFLFLTTEGDKNLLICSQKVFLLFGF